MALIGRYGLAIFILLFPLRGLADSSDQRKAVPLVVAINENFDMPFAFHDQGKVYPQGIIYEVMEELGLRLQVDVRYLVIPRRRLKSALSSGLVHIQPLGNPKWYQNEEAITWSFPWLKDDDRFVVRTEDVHLFRSVADMEGRQVGTLLGYTYPELPDFIVRRSSKSLMQNMERLERGRLDAVIESSVVMRYQLKDAPSEGTLFLLPFVAGNADRSMGLSVHAPISMKELSKVLRSMKDDGWIEKIRMRY